jgi:hypothetical protein
LRAVIGNKLAKVERIKGPMIKILNQHGLGGPINSIKGLIEEIS